jgi:hypothetical protein
VRVAHVIAVLVRRVTLHPRAQQTIHDMWRLADLPDPAPDRRENQSRVVVIEAIEDVDRAKVLVQPYLDDARTVPAPEHEQFAPFTDEAIEVLLARSDGKPRDLLRKAYALIEQGSANNWDNVDGPRAAFILDSLATPEEDGAVAGVAAGTSTPLEEMWIS